VASNNNVLNTLHSGEIYVHCCLCELFDFSSKVGSLCGGSEGIERHGIEASSAGRAS
jgi:hypothetical protein